jgi:diacylglycerol kinase (ATP)
MLRLWKALLYSMAGLRDAWAEPAFRLELLALALAVPVALWLPVATLEKLAMIGSVVAVLVVELLNTSVEAAVDRIGAERHELSRMAKDMGSAAVLIAAIMSAIVWALLAGPPLLSMLRLA